MARARLVVADMNSAEMDSLRRQFNNLLLVIENVSSEVDAGNITADEAFTALVTVLNSGVDGDIAAIDGGANNYAGTNREILGVKPTPLHPKQVRGVTRDMDKDSNF